MSAYSMHTSTEAWGPDASGFYLDLWLRLNKKGLEQDLCTFSEGSRDMSWSEVSHLFNHKLSQIKLVMHWVRFLIRQVVSLRLRLRLCWLTCFLSTRSTQILRVKIHRTVIPSRWRI
jgi:hypothetical protein